MGVGVCVLYPPVLYSLACLQISIHINASVDIKRGRGVVGKEKRGVHTESERGGRAQDTKKIAYFSI